VINSTWRERYATELSQRPQEDERENISYARQNTPRPRDRARRIFDLQTDKRKRKWEGKGKDFHILSCTGVDDVVNGGLLLGINQEKNDTEENV